MFRHDCFSITASVQHPSKFDDATKLILMFAAFARDPCSALFELDQPVPTCIMKANNAEKLAAPGFFAQSPRHRGLLILPDLGGHTRVACGNDVPNHGQGY